MQYYSLNRQSPDVDFKEASLRGQAPDKGLYFPEKIAQLPADFIQNLKQLSKKEIAYQILAPYTGDTIPADVLKQICNANVHTPNVKEDEPQWGEMAADKTAIMGELVPNDVGPCANED